MSAAPHRLDIDGLRGVAILGVLLYHAMPGLLPGGFIGVDIFFVISGYLITGIVLADAAAGQFSLRRFYANRIRRIFPALLTVLISSLIIGWFILLPDEYSALGKHTIASTAFISNFTLWKEAGYFDMAADFKPLLHLWSLSVEEQFYLIWPPLLLAVWRRNIHVNRTLTTLTALSLAASIIFTTPYPVASFYLPSARFWQLMAGGLLAYGQWKGKTTPASARSLLAWLGVLLILLAAVSFSKANIYPGWRSVLPVMGTVALIAAGTQSWVNHRLLCHPLPVTLGLISYPLYLWHWPLLAFTRITAGGESGITQRIMAVVTAALLAWLTMRYIERPIRFGRLRHSSRTIAILIAGLVAVGAVGYGIKIGGGFPRTRGIESVRLEDLARINDFSSGRFPCAAALHGDLLDWCATSQPGAPDAAVYGDSHADHLFPGLVHDGRHNWLLIGQSSCPPLIDIHAYAVGRPSACIKKNSLALAGIINTASIHTVLLASLGAYYVMNESFAPDHQGKNDAKKLAHGKCADGRGRIKQSRVVLSRDGSHYQCT